MSEEEEEEEVYEVEKLMGHRRSITNKVHYIHMKLLLAFQT